MIVERKVTLFSLVTVGLSVGSLVLVSRSLLRLLSKWRLNSLSNQLIRVLKLRLDNPLPTTTVVTCNTHWNPVYELISNQCNIVPVLGFDCEWTTFNRKSNPVALIQIASCMGTCALIRVCCLSSLPPSLKDLLSNPKILKVGVAAYDDAAKLKRDMNLAVQGCFDVRHLISKHPKIKNMTIQQSLAGLSHNLLDVKLNKTHGIRCSDWEADVLSEAQIKYAAKDALASIAIYLQLVKEIHVQEYQFSLFPNIEQLHSKPIQYVEQLVDTKYRCLRRIENQNWNKQQLRKSNTKHKSTSRHPARKTPLYDNCILQAPDGQPLCTCDTKKALWYVSKNRGFVVSEDPMIVRLNFEPAGRPCSDYDSYYLLSKANMCVVCGKQESFLRKNIVPHEYRRHFPVFLKDHKSHDILLLCLDCHTRSNILDNELKYQLGIECNAPIGTEKDVKMKLDKRLSGIQKAANALSQNRLQMPAARIAELEQVITSYYQVTEVSEELIEKARNLDIHIYNAEYSPHGLKVVKYYEEKFGILSLERRWREHFIQSMKPEFLPELWSIEHNRTVEEKWKRAQPN